MTSQYGKLRVALLGMSDNRITMDLISFLANEGVELKAVILQVPDLKANLNRLKRKLAAAGLRETILRIRFAVARIAARKFYGHENPVGTEKSNTFFVSDPNDEEVTRIIGRRGIDVLLLSTDSIIRKRVFSAPGRVTLNAHPGKIPQFRGLGGLVVQVFRDVAPSMSVHMVNEGIDTGPVLLRETLPDRVLFVNNDERQQILTQWQAKLFARVLQKLASGSATVIDTFLEPSNMTRGVTSAFAARAWASANRKMKEN